MSDKFEKYPLPLRLTRGWFNRYRRAMPWLERLGKDGRWLANWLRLRLKGTVPMLYVYPHFPSRGSMLYKVALNNGWLITNRMPQRLPIAAFTFEYTTAKGEKTGLLPLVGKCPVFNYNLASIDKVVIDNLHLEVFGYATQVDWQDDQGVAVLKNRINAKHDGHIVELPLESAPKPEFICQRLIDNTTSDGYVLDYRVAVLNDELVLVYRKKRRIEERFTNATRHAELAEINKLFTVEEQLRIRTFCKELHLDYGELDILRDNNSGRIYIVDVNDTPQGPPKGISRKEGQLAVDMLGTALKNLLS